MIDSRKEQIKTSIYKLASIAFWICLWELASRAWNQSLLLPAPSGVLISLFTLSLQESFWRIIFTSFIKI